MRPALRFAACWLLIFALEVAAHAPLLALPYYWDEAGYYIPAAYDFFRTGTLIPFSTLTNAHPPGLSVYLAAAWKLFGFHPVVTRVSMCLLASAALLGVFRLALDALKDRWAAAAVLLLTATYPVFFAQSTLAHADMAACAASVWGLRFALREPISKSGSKSNSRRDAWAAAGCFALAALTKEIAIGTPLALAAFELFARRRKRAAVLCLPVLPLAAWFAYHRARTGFAFGNPGYLRYNALGTLTPERMLLSFGHRALHLSAHLNLFVPVVLALGSLALPPVRARLSPFVEARIWVVIAANAVLFSVLGGALLTRYLLPEYALVLLLTVAAVYARFRSWWWFPAAGVAAFIAALVLPTPYRVAPEDTLAYSDAVVLEQEAIRFVAERFPHGAVLSAWPVTDGLTKPELGYVRTPLAVVPIDNFSLAALEKLAASPVSYSTAIVFSTKYEPTGFHLQPWDGHAEERFFDLHHDLSAGAVAVLLHGTVVWQGRRGAEWAAVLRFEHPQLARAPILFK